MPCLAGRLCRVCRARAASTPLGRCNAAAGASRARGKPVTRGAARFVPRARQRYHSRQARGLFDWKERSMAETKSQYPYETHLDVLHKHLEVIDVSAIAGAVT